MAAIKAEADRFALKSSADLVRLQESLSQAHDDSSRYGMSRLLYTLIYCMTNVIYAHSYILIREIAYLKAKIEKETTALTDMLETEKKALSEANAQNKALTQINADLEERMAQMTAFHSADREARAKLEADLVKSK